MFFIKTIYSVLVSLFCLICNIPFPFIPIQITVIDAAMEAWPSFLTIFESNTARPKGTFLKTALGNAFPFALAVTGSVVAVSLTAPFAPGENQTVMYFVLILLTMAAVIKSCIPFSKLRIFICATMVIGTFGGLHVLPQLFEISALDTRMKVWTIMVFIIAFLFVCIYTLIRKAMMRCR